MGLLNKIRGLFNREDTLIRRCADRDAWPETRLYRIPHETVASCLEYLEKNGIQVSNKHHSWPNSHTTTAYPGVLRLAYDFDRYPMSEQATTLAHEVTHYNNRKHGHGLAAYLTNPWELVISECNSYFLGMYARDIMRGRKPSYKNHADEIAELPDLLRDLYITPRAINRKKLRRVVRAAARKALG